MKKFIISLVCFSLFTLAAQAKVNFPYGEFSLKIPPLQEPYPGIGNYYSTISKGVGTMMWNPASLAKIGTTEASLSIAGSSDIQRLDKIVNLSDATYEATLSGALKSPVIGVYYDYPANVGTQKITREVEGRYNYVTESSGITCQQALKINDWLSAGLIYRGPIEGNANLIGDFPTTGKFTMDLNNATFEGQPVWLDSDNKLNYVFTEPISGTTISTKSVAAIWDGFVTQEATVPFTTYLDARNNININSNLTAGLAGTFKNIAWGINFTPIAAEMNIDNSAKTLVNAGTSDIILYSPNFDLTKSPTQETWFTDVNKYGSSEGYNQVTVKIPAGQAVADSKYKGFYTASAMRMDLGAMYDVNDRFRVAFAYENFNSASLNFSGAGRVTYAQSRIGTPELGSISPGSSGESNSKLFNDTYAPIAGTENYALEPEKNFALPQKIRIGGALIKPIVIAVDYESQLTPIKLRAKDSTGNYTNISVSNINFIKIGADFNFIRLGATLMLKPTIENADVQTVNNINKAFKYTALPLKFDLGTGWSVWGVKTDFAFGYNTMSILDALQFNTLSADLSKLLFYSLSFNKNYWTINYLATVDPISTYIGYSNAKSSNPSKSSLEWGDIKWVSTVQATYRF